MRLDALFNNGGLAFAFSALEILGQTSIGFYQVTIALHRWPDEAIDMECLLSCRVLAVGLLIVSTERQGKFDIECDRRFRIDWIDFDEKIGLVREKRDRVCLLKPIADKHGASSRKVSGAGQVRPIFRFWVENVPFRIEVQANDGNAPLIVEISGYQSGFGK